MIFSFFKKLSPKKAGATIIIALGLSVLLIIFTVGVGSVVRNTTGSIKAFNNQWQARLATESVKEKLLLLAKNKEAGFSTTEAQCNSEITEVLDTTAPALYKANAAYGGICSIEGKNTEEVEDPADTTKKLYTVPNANTGDAGLDCSPLKKFTTGEMLKAYYNTTGTEATQSTAAKLLFDDNPLNHPCNWGKLKFGNNFSSRVVVPLYYDSSTATDEESSIQNPKENELTQLQIKVRTPCLPIAEREDCQKDPTTGAITAADPAACQYEDICKPSDRYQFDIGDGSTKEDETIVVWQISGECSMKDGTAKDLGTESCAMIPNDSLDSKSGKRNLLSNSEIYESFINNFSDGTVLNNYIDQGKLGKIAYYDSHEYYTGTRTLKNFLTYLESSTIQVDDAPTYYTAITKPLLQLAISVDELKDSSTKTRSIPYLEYQVVTDVPVSNTTQEFKTEINYGGQSFQQSYSIEQKKNVVDFALQD